MPKAGDYSTDESENPEYPFVRGAGRGKRKRHTDRPRSHHQGDSSPRGKERRPSKCFSKEGDDVKSDGNRRSRDRESSTYRSEDAHYAKHRESGRSGTRCMKEITRCANYIGKERSGRSPRDDGSHRAKNPESDRSSRRIREEDERPGQYTERERSGRRHEDENTRHAREPESEPSRRKHQNSSRANDRRQDATDVDSGYATGEGVHGRSQERHSRGNREHRNEDTRRAESAAKEHSSRRYKEERSRHVEDNRKKGSDRRHRSEDECRVEQNESDCSSRKRGESRERKQCKEQTSRASERNGKYEGQSQENLERTQDERVEGDRECEARRIWKDGSKKRREESRSGKERARDEAKEPDRRHRHRNSNHHTPHPIDRDPRFARAEDKTSSRLPRNVSTEASIPSLFDVAKKVLVAKKFLVPQVEKESVRKAPDKPKRRMYGPGPNDPRRRQEASPSPQKPSRSNTEQPREKTRESGPKRSVTEPREKPEIEIVDWSTQDRDEQPSSRHPRDRAQSRGRPRRRSFTPPPPRARPPQDFADLPGPDFFQRNTANGHRVRHQAPGGGSPKGYTEENLKWACQLLHMVYPPSKDKYVDAVLGVLEGIKELGEVKRTPENVQTGNNLDKAMHIMLKERGFHIPLEVRDWQRKCKEEGGGGGGGGDNAEKVGSQDGDGVEFEVEEAE